MRRYDTMIILIISNSNHPPLFCPILASMKSKRFSANWIQVGANYFMPSVSLDCVIFGFHDNQLKVLLLKMKAADHWALPGGFILKAEDVETAAKRVLRERTGIEDIFLQQFYVFGKPGRSDKNQHLTRLKREGIPVKPDNWILQRFITVGYFALVNFSKVIPKPDQSSVTCEWHDLKSIQSLFMDHLEILNKALETMRSQLNHLPVGYNLLPNKFTMPELQALYETILDKKLDRRNFQRRITSFGFIKKLKETRKGGAHKAPFLYSFNLKKYQKALQEGLQGGW